MHSQSEVFRGLFAGEPFDEATFSHSMSARLNDMKEELSYAYVHAVAARAGFDCDRPHRDRDSTDVIVQAHNFVRPDSIIKQPRLELQLKATARDVFEEPDFSFALPIKNYRDLSQPNAIPKLLVVFAMPLDEGLWLEHQAEHLITRRCAFWLSLFGQPAVQNETSRTVRVPTSNVFNVEALTELMGRASKMELPYV
jgi:hypothetical protein